LPRLSGIPQKAGNYEFLNGREHGAERKESSQRDGFQGGRKREKSDDRLPLKIYACLPVGRIAE